MKTIDGQIIFENDTARWEGGKYAIVDLPFGLVFNTKLQSFNSSITHGFEPFELGGLTLRAIAPAASASGNYYIARYIVMAEGWKARLRASVYRATNKFMVSKAYRWEYHILGLFGYWKGKCDGSLFPRYGLLAMLHRINHFN